MLILASKSPRRIELLKQIYTKEIKVIPSNIDETKLVSSSVYDLPLIIAKAKGKDISIKYKDDYVLSADTIVICNNKKYGKPKNEQDAYDILSMLNEKEHDVVTGYAIYKDGIIFKECSVKSTLIIHNLTDKIIKEYIKTKSPFDKAGAYGIQDLKYINTSLVYGSYYNVMGLPIEQLKKDIEELGI